MNLPFWVEENKPAGTAVGIIETSDQDAGDSLLYSLVEGSGSSGNSYFRFSDSTSFGRLETSGVLILRETQIYSVRVRVRDQSGASAEEAIEIRILDVAEAPTNLTLTLSNELRENLPTSSSIGELELFDGDTPVPLTAELINGEEEDNHLITLTSGGHYNHLILEESLDFESNPTINIRIKEIQQPRV